MKADLLLITRFAVDKLDTEPLNEQELSICDEWTSGQAAENMKIATNDDRLLEYAALYDKLEVKKEDVWKGIAAVDMAGEILTASHESTPAGRKRTGVYILWSLAAAVTVLAFIGAFLYYSDRNVDSTFRGGHTTHTEQQTTSQPTALLILDDSSQIKLDALPVGLITSEGETKIFKQSASQIAYVMAGNSLLAAREFKNRIFTPFARQYKIVLADGSKVLLNAGSTLQYPTSFNGHDRPVVITGEGYFEVAENKSKPFRVIAQGVEIKVMGTTFNVKAYPSDEAVTTTLIDGSLAVYHAGVIKTITPGQQVLAYKDNVKIKSMNRDRIDQSLAWKNGLINLEDESVQSIMEQLQRSYNVQFRVEEGTPEITMTGNIDKSAPLTQVLKLLNTSESVQFTFDGKTVVASKKNN